MVGTIIGYLLLVLFLAGVVWWVRYSVWKIKPEEIGILILAGVPFATHGPGFCFIPKWLGNAVKRVPAKGFTIAVPKFSVHTPEVSGCKREMVVFSAKFHVEFPRDRRLITIDHMGIPTKEDDLLRYFEPVIKQAAILILSTQSWKADLDNMIMTRRDIQTVTMVEAVIKNFTDAGGTFQLIIDAIEGSDELKSLISYENQVKMTTDLTGKIVARKAALFADTFVKEVSKVTGQPLKEVKQDIKTKLLYQVTSKLLQVNSDERTVDGHTWDGSRLTSFHVSGPGNSIQNFARSLSGGQQQGGQQGGRTINRPDGTSVVMSAEERKERGLSF